MKRARLIPWEIERVARLGWHVYPSSQWSKAACFKEATDAASSNLDTIARWYRQYPGCNWRVVFGPSQLWGIDVDVPSANHQADGAVELKNLIARFGPLPHGPRTRS